MTLDITSQANERLKAVLTRQRISLSKLSPEELTHWLDRWLGANLHLRNLHGFTDLSHSVHKIREFGLELVHPSSGSVKEHAADQLRELLLKENRQTVYFDENLLNTHVIPVLGSGGVFLPYNASKSCSPLGTILGKKTEKFSKADSRMLLAESEGCFLVVKRTDPGQDRLFEVRYATEIVKTFLPTSSDLSQVYVPRHQLTKLELQPIPIDSFAEHFGAKAGLYAFYTLFSLSHAFRKTHKAAKEAASDAKFAHDQWQAIVSATYN